MLVLVDRSLGLGVSTRHAYSQEQSQLSRLMQVNTAPRHVRESPRQHRAAHRISSKASRSLSTAPISRPKLRCSEWVPCIACLRRDSRVHNFSRATATPISSASFASSIGTFAHGLCRNQVGILFPTCDYYYDIYSRNLGMSGLPRVPIQKAGRNTSDRLAVATKESCAIRVDAGRRTIGRRTTSSDTSSDDVNSQNFQRRRNELAHILYGSPIRRPSLV